MATIGIIGVTGMVGSDLAREAVRRGHTVIGVSRHGAPETPLAGVEYRVGDFADTDAVMDLANSVDVLIITTASGRATGDWAPVLSAHEALIKRQPTTRLFVVGGAGGLRDDEGVRLIDNGFIPEDYAEPRVFARVLDMYLHSNPELNWVMQVPAITIEPGQASEQYVLGGDHAAGTLVTTGTFARAAIDEIEQPAHSRERYNVANA